MPSIAYSNTKEDVDIVVIDNNSSDDSVSYIKEWHPEIKTISLTKNYGFADGYNKGLLTIDTEYIVLLNSDVMVTTGWLDPIIDMMEADPTIGVTQPLILSLENKNNLNTLVQQVDISIRFLTHFAGEGYLMMWKKIQANTKTIQKYSGQAEQPWSLNQNFTRISVVLIQCILPIMKK